MEGARQLGKRQRGGPNKPRKKALPKKLKRIYEIRQKDDTERKKVRFRLKKEAPPRGTSAFAHFAASSERTPQEEKEDSEIEDESEEEVENEKTKNEKRPGFIAARKFSELPLSSYTLQGLETSKFTRLTDIQRAAIPHALVGRDILGAARTGSGKTLAFVIPLLEKLFLQRWGLNAGVGGIIITPSRELAVQIFDVVRAVGKTHRLSMGLVIGGKDFEHEQETIPRMNVIVCTPGRLLQHMDETEGFDCTNLQMLVLDEADRILDMGFAKTLNAILENIPKARQTLLFSATQTKSVRDLARLSLNEPEYISVHEKAEIATPKKLVQHVIICELPDKLNTLWTFIKTHLKSKILVFLSTCKQVSFVFEMFRRIQPGTPLLYLHSKVNQTKRMATYFDFCEKKHAVLLATDIASRGLDFRKIDWVLQVDCPEDVDTYIHRAGRTASEKKMIELLEEKKVPVKVLNVNNAKQMTITDRLREFVVKPELRDLAQKAFTNYIRSIWVQSLKDVFDVYALPAEEFAESLGLTEMPQIKFLKSVKKDKNISRKFAKLVKEMKEEESEEEESEEEEESGEEEEDSESEDESEEGSEQEEEVSQGEDEDSDEDDEEGSSDEEEEAPKPKRAKVDSQSLQEQEQLALKILEQRHL